MILAAFMWLRFRCLLASAITKDSAEMQMLSTLHLRRDQASQQNLPANRCNGLLWTSHRSGGRDPGRWGKCACYTHVRLCVNMKRTGWMFNSSLYFGLSFIQYDFQYTHYKDITCPILLKGAILSMLVVIELITACRIVMHLTFHACSGPKSIWTCRSHFKR